MKKALVSFLIGGLLFVGLSVFGQSFPTWNLIGGALSPVNLTWKIGAGTTTPIYLLDVYGNARLGTSTASSLFFRGLSNFNDLFFIDASGNASTTGEWKGAKFTPEKLNYANATSDEQYLTYEASGNAFEWTTLPSGFTYDPPWITNGSILYSSSTFSNFAFGTTTPTGFLELYAATTTNTQLTITVATDTTTYDPRIVFRTGSNPTARFAVGVDYSDSNKFKIATSTLGVNDILTIDGNGRIGLGTTTPAQILAVQATGSIPALGVYASNSTPALFVNTNGDVGIGTVTPTSMLHVSGSSGFIQAQGSSSGARNGFRVLNDSNLNLDFTYYGSLVAGTLAGINKTSLAVIEMGDANRNLMTYLPAGTGNIYFAPNNAISMTIAGSSYPGNIGIGTTTPSSLLEIVSATNTAAQLTLTVATSTNTADPKIVFRTGNEVTRFALGVDYSDSNKFKIATTTLGTNDIFVVDQNGRVGFGTSSPANVSTFLVYGTSTFKGGSVKIGSAETANPLATLDVYASSSTKFWRTAILRRGIQGGDTELPTEFGFPYLQIGGIENRDNSIQSIGFGYVDSVATGNSSAIPPGEIGFQTTNTGGFTIGDLVFGTRSVNTETAALERMRITSSGKVGIGTSSPASILSIQGTSTTPALGVYASNSTPALFVNTNGDVGIGTVTPAAKLQIVSLSTADIGGLLQTTNEGDINLRWGSTAARYGQLSWQTSPTLHATIKGTASRDLSLGAGDVNDYLWIDRTGKIGVGTTSPLFAVDVEGNINIASGNTYKIGDADAVTAASTTAWNIAYDRASSSVMAFTVTDATSTPSSKNPLILKKFERAATIYKINCIADPLGTTGDQMTIDIWEADSTGQATSSVDATIACGTAGATDDGALTNPIIDASDWIYLHMKSASGSVESLGVSIYYY